MLQSPKRLIFKVTKSESIEYSRLRVGAGSGTGPGSGTTTADSKPPSTAASGAGVEGDMIE